MITYDAVCVIYYFRKLLIFQTNFSSANKSSKELHFSDLCLLVIHSGNCKNETLDFNQYEKVQLGNEYKKVQLGND